GAKRGEAFGRCGGGRERGKKPLCLSNPRSKKKGKVRGILAAAEASNGRGWRSLKAGRSIPRSSDRRNIPPLLPVACSPRRRRAGRCRLAGRNSCCGG